MKSPLEGGSWNDYDEVLSTQDLAATDLKEGRGGVYFASHQTLGRGRLGREWSSSQNESLTMSMTFAAYPDHPAPYLIAMLVAVAAAAVIKCEIKWPNDLVFGDWKVGGILTEMCPDTQGRRIPVVGLGINLNNRAFPAELKGRATSLALYRGGSYVPREVAEQILEKLKAMPEPESWSSVKPMWDLFDYTAGRNFRMSNGDVGNAVGVGDQGQLLLMIDGEIRSVYAADAFFG